MKLSRLLAISVFGAWSCASVPQQQPGAGALSDITATRLERFHSHAEFYDYMTRLRRAARAQHLWWAQDQKEHPAYGGVEYDMEAGAPPPPPPPPPAPPPPPPAAPGQQAQESAIVVTGSRIPSGENSANPSITNVQTRGVDEGDIVKQIGHFLIVLQDGRLFTVDLHPPRGGLAFIDRVNVYRNASTESWYDEMLVYRNRVVVTGYSYVRRASEVTVFAMSDEGRLTREAVYYMSSNDYYDPENYATRLVDDNLVIYSPALTDAALPEQSRFVADHPPLDPRQRPAHGAEQRRAAVRSARHLSPGAADT